MSAALSFEPDEPEGSGLPGSGWSQGEGAPQRLYVTLAAEELTLEGFAEEGRADTMAPGPTAPHRDRDPAGQPAPRRALPRMGEAARQRGRVRGQPDRARPGSGTDGNAGL